MIDVVEVFVIIDNFCKLFIPKYLRLLKNNNHISRVRSSMLSTSEIILFQQSGYACFKLITSTKKQLMKSKFIPANIF